MRVRHLSTIVTFCLRNSVIHLELDFEGWRRVGVFLVKRRRKRMKGYLQHWIGASPGSRGRSGAGSWWRTDALLPGGWHWGTYRNQREAGERERHLNEDNTTVCIALHVI